MEFVSFEIFVAFVVKTVHRDTESQRKPNYLCVSVTLWLGRSI